MTYSEHGYVERERETCACQVSFPLVSSWRDAVLIEWINKNLNGSSSPAGLNTQGG